MAIDEDRALPLRQVPKCLQQFRMGELISVDGEGAVWRRDGHGPSLASEFARHVDCRCHDPALGVRVPRHPSPAHVGAGEGLLGDVLGQLRVAAEPPAHVVGVGQASGFDLGIDQRARRTPEQGAPARVEVEAVNSTVGVEDRDSVLKIDAGDGRRHRPRGQTLGSPDGIHVEPSVT